MRRTAGLVCILLAGCSTPTATQTTSIPAAAQPTPPQPTPSLCLPADGAASSIAEGLEAGVTIRGTQGVAVGDGTYLVAADLEGPGLDTGKEIAVWATDSLDTPSFIIAVDAVAREFSTWGDAAQPGSRADDLRRGFFALPQRKAAEECVQV